MKGGSQRRRAHPAVASEESQDIHPAHRRLCPWLEPSADGGENSGRVDASALRHVVHKYGRDDHDRVGALPRGTEQPIDNQDGTDESSCH